MAQAASTTYLDLHIEAVLVGEKKIEHTIKVPPAILEKSSARHLGKEFLKRQYPTRFPEMIDIAAHIVGEEKSAQPKERKITRRSL